MQIILINKLMILQFQVTQYKLKSWSLDDIDFSLMFKIQHQEFLSLFSKSIVIHITFDQ